MKQSLAEITKLRKKLERTKDIKEVKFTKMVMVAKHRSLMERKRVRT